jgi:hypothetical protein
MWRGRLLQASCVLAVAACGVPACEPLECTADLRTAFVVALSINADYVPNDLVFRLQHGTAAITLAFDPAEDAFRTIGGSSALGACRLDHPSDGGEQGRPFSILCGWGSDDGPGSFDASAAGYTPVHIELFAPLDEAGCQPVLQRAQATLERP